MTFPLDREKRFSLPGPVGKLEVITMYPAKAEPLPITAVICHPHPLYLGTMNNKVVHTVAKALAELGIKSIRFNFRGVGESEGEYGEGIGETEDTLAIVNWVRANCPDDKLWLAGFSFGAYVATRTASEVKPSQLITVAPAVEHFNFAEIPIIDCPWLVIQGESDEVVPPELVFKWLQTVTPQPELIRFPGVGHFFHGKLIDLRDTIVNYFADKLNHE